MIKNLKIFISVVLISIVMTIESSTQHINEQPLLHLAHVKNYIKSIQLQDIVFDAFIDQTQQATLQRRGFLILRPHALGTVVMCHGYLGCKRDAIALQHLFPDYNILAFDFRAHGDDRDGQFSTIGRDEAFDVMGAVAFVKSNPLMANKPIIAFGYSMGAVSAIQAQAMHGSLFDAMILDCPYDSTDDAMRRGLDQKMQISLFGQKINIPGKDFIVNHMYDPSAQMITNFLFQLITQFDTKKVATKFVKVMPVESVQKITVPCFFIHCENDTKVPIHAVERLYHNKPGFKRLWITQGKSHFGSYQYNPELYWYKVNKFLTKWRLQGTEERQQEKICDQRTQPVVNNELYQLQRSLV